MESHINRYWTRIVTLHDERSEPDFVTFASHAIPPQSHVKVYKLGSSQETHRHRLGASSTAETGLHYSIPARYPHTHPSSQIDKLTKVKSRTSAFGNQQSRKCILSDLSYASHLLSSWRMPLRPQTLPRTLPHAPARSRPLSAPARPPSSSPRSPGAPTRPTSTARTATSPATTTTTSPTPWTE